MSNILTFIKKKRDKASSVLEIFEVPDVGFNLRKSNVLMKDVF